MEDNSLKQPRRDFLGKIAAGAAAMGIATIATPLNAAAGTFRIDGTSNPDDAEAWFNKLDGAKHKIMFDVTKPHEVHAFCMVQSIYDDQCGYRFSG